MLRVFALRDADLGDRQAGILTYDTDLKLYEITVDGSIAPADLPLSLEIRIREGSRRISHDEALSWVRGRICPPGRHNIHEILRENGLKEYDEFELLMVTNAKCGKDGLYLAEEICD